MSATREDLKSLQSEPLDHKILRTMGLIDEWYSRWNDQVYVSFSGGKDSTVLADLCTEYCSKRQIPLCLVFVDTGLEYPEVRQHTKDFAEFLRGGARVQA
ncbi:MAG: phosphoadenosine phosphosulfate reductase family protein [Clostridia bacterium]|nr:phosphoadenosine phosphosulfate reductase family protein [Clostridia bacterium]